MLFLLIKQKRFLWDIPLNMQIKFREQQQIYALCADSFLSFVANFDLFPIDCRILLELKRFVIDSFQMIFLQKIFTRVCRGKFQVKNSKVKGVQLHSKIFSHRDFMSCNK